MPTLAPTRSREEWIKLTASMPEKGPCIRGETFYDSPFAVWKRLGRPADGSLIVDVGCGHGRMAVPLVDLPGVRYVGLDIIPEMLAWNEQAFRPYQRISFQDLGVANGRYRPEGSDPAEVRFPVEDASADLVLAISLFTHLGSVAALEAYLAECIRILKPGGRMLTSFFFCPPNKLDGGADRTVYGEGYVITLLAFLGFRLLWREGGTTPEFIDQCDMLLVKL